MANFKADKVTNYEHMFDGCENLNNINIGNLNFNIDNGEKYKNIFRGIPNDGSIVCNKNTAKNFVGILPGAWEKVII